jgi:glycosyltransferase involved in cell wall biosynthesis
MRVFIASPYHSGSHRAWAEGYAATSRHEIHQATMPGSFWQWRLTGGFVTLSEQIEALAAKYGLPDLILATSLVDVAGLRGLVSRTLGVVPTALYMHENQVTYPAISRSRTERTYGLTNWTSLLAADAVAFNSEFHRDALWSALPPFLNEFPDERHHPHLDAVIAKSTVLPVGCELAGAVTGPRNDPPRVVWNHRWDPDKDPATCLRILQSVADAGVDFEVALLGERFVNQRYEYDEAVDRLGDRVVVDGHADRDAYLEELGQVDVVISTALQEFFGVAVVEAMAAGALPLLPNRLVYPERVPETTWDRTLFDSEQEAVELLQSALTNIDATRQLGAELAATVAPFDWGAVAPRYDAWLDSTAAS